VDDRQAARGVQAGPHDGQFAQQDGDRHPHRHKADLLAQALSGRHAAHRVHHGEPGLDDQQGTGPQQAGQMGEAEDDRLEWLQPAQHRPPAQGRGAEMAFRRTAGKDVAIGAAATQQGSAALARQAVLDAAGGGGVAHAGGPAG